jgi:hypothetical protein
MYASMGFANDEGTGSNGGMRVEEETAAVVDGLMPRLVSIEEVITTHRTVGVFSAEDSKDEDIDIVGS